MTGSSGHHRARATPSPGLLWLATLRVAAEEREFAEGDLREEFADRVARDGATAARRWLRRHAWRSATTRLSSPATSAQHPAHRPQGVVMSGITRDLGFAWRLLRQAPFISLAAILTFALGIGANAAIFSVAWPILGARLAVPDEDRLAFILLSVPGRSEPTPNPISPGDYVDLLDARSFDGLAGFNMFATQRNLTDREQPEQLQVGTVTETFFTVLGIPPVLGRAIDGRDFAAGARSLVLDERTWRRLFGADPGIIGRAVRMDDVPWTIVGVMPASATVGTIAVDAWSTQPIDRASARQFRSYYLAMIGRLRPGVTLADANRELEDLMRRAADAYPASNMRPDGRPILARAESFRERLTGPIRPAFLMLIGGAALVLVVAAVNLIGLQVARNLARRQELGVRRALGAGRVRVIRQLTVESLLLAALGGGVGLGAAALTLAGLSRLAPVVAWHQISPQLTASVTLFTLALTFAVGLAVGLIPAVSASGGQGTGLASARGATASRPTTRLRAGIVGVQTAMTVVLLIVATLSAASLGQVLRVDPGFEIDRGLIADVRLTRGETSDQIRFYHDLVSRAEALPGVTQACAINNVPLDNDGATMTFVAEGRTDADMIGALPMGVTDGCFETLRIPLRRGRGFHRQESESVVIVNETMARRLWPDDPDPVGKRVHIGLVSGPLFTVVGVAADIRASALESAFTRQVWMSASRGWPMPQRLILRSDVPPSELARPLRSLLAEMDRTLAVANIRTMSDIVGEATASRRFVLVLLGSFAAMAVVLCAVGIYGMLAHQVGQRRREIGIRLALGAARASVGRAVARQALAGVMIGAAAGLSAGWLLSSFVATQLYRVSATDVRVYAGVTAFVLLVAAAACWAPIRRATRVNPVTALRE